MTTVAACPREQRHKQPGQIVFQPWKVNKELTSVAMVSIEGLLRQSYPEADGTVTALEVRQLDGQERCGVPDLHCSLSMPMA